MIELMSHQEAMDFANSPEGHQVWFEKMHETMIAISEKHEYAVHRNEKINTFLKTLPAEERRGSRKMLDFIKREFPECRDVILGELVYSREE